jgi:hypothetical protein
VEAAAVTAARAKPRQSSKQRRAGLPRWPELLEADRAADYVSVSVSRFLGLVSKGTMPPARLLDGQRRWSVEDLNRAIRSLPLEGGGERNSFDAP